MSDRMALSLLFLLMGYGAIGIFVLTKIAVSLEACLP